MGLNLRRLLSNRSRCTVELWPMDDRHGREIIVAIAKLTYAVTPDGHVTLAKSVIREHDVTSGSEPWAGIRYPSDVFDEKPGTDVLLAGSAHPPHDGGSVMSVTLRVGPVQKTVRVYGPRAWRESATGRVVPGAPGPLGITPLVWELAWGGRDDADPNHPMVAADNPSGSGLAKHARTLVGRAAPQLEDTDAPLDSRAPRPACFAPIPAHWSPRAERAGTYDEEWRRRRAPIRPLDFDPLHNSCAPPHQWSETPLRGDEPIAISGVTPEGTWSFALPLYQPRFVEVRRGLVREHPTHLDTLLIDADARTVELCWRAQVALPKQSAALEQIDVFSGDEAPLRAALARAALAHAGLLETHG